MGLHEKEQAQDLIDVKHFDRLFHYGDLILVAPHRTDDGDVYPHGVVLPLALGNRPGFVNLTEALVLADKALRQHREILDRLTAFPDPDDSHQIDARTELEAVKAAKERAARLRIRVTEETVKALAASILTVAAEVFGQASEAQEPEPSAWNALVGQLDDILEVSGEQQWTGTFQQAEEYKRWIQSGEYTEAFRQRVQHFIHNVQTTPAYILRPRKPEARND